MNIKIGVEFVTDADEENAARAAASLAAWNFLALVEESTQGREVKSVTVHVDGYGPVEVAVGQDHD